MNDKRLKPRTDTLRELYIFSGNMCAMPDCKQVLIDEDGTWIGEVAHIHAASDGGLAPIQAYLKRNAERLKT